MGNICRHYFQRPDRPAVREGAPARPGRVEAGGGGHLRHLRRLLPQQRISSQAGARASSGGHLPGKNYFNGRKSKLVGYWCALVHLEKGCTEFRLNTKDSSCNVFFYIEVLFFVMDFFIGCWVDDRLDELTERGRPNLAANLASAKKSVQ